MSDHENGRPTPAKVEAASVPTAVKNDNTLAAALRCAWLRVHADQLCDIDPSGQLSAQLRDFADLIEVAEREGWWSR